MLLEALGSSIYFFCFVAGSALGSFGRVLVDRYEATKGLGIGSKLVEISRLSSCPKCGRAIPPYNNIPVVSYLALKGRAKCCGSKIPFSYFTYEVAAGLIALFGMFLFLHFSH